MRTLIYLKAKLHVLNENENVVCFIAILTQRVYFSSRNLIGRFVGVLLKDDAEKQHFEDPSGKLNSSLHIYKHKLLSSQMLKSLKYDLCTKKFGGVSST